MELEPIELPTDEGSAPSAPASSITHTHTHTHPFDLDAYIARYEPASETRLQRLLLIGSSLSSAASSSAAQSPTTPATATATANDAVAAQAYRLAERQCRATANVRTYRQVFGGGGGGPSGEATTCTVASGNEESSAARTIPPDLLDSHSNSNSNLTLLPAAQHLLPHQPAKYGLPFDATWATTADHTSQLHLQTLEARLSQAQSRLAKDAIRTAHLALAEHHRLRGALRDALRHLLRCRDVCTTTRQSGTVCRLVVELGVDLRNFALVKDYVAKAEHTAELLPTDPLLAAQLRAANGLALLAEGRYADAARTFATVPSDLTTQFATVLSAEDLALYGSLLGMAALDRTELQTLILDSPTFQGRLELVPPLQEALRRYALADYGSALALLSEQVRPLLALDLHLRPHAEGLLRRIRDRCLVHYWAPYSKVSLVAMAEAFHVPPTEMERLVARLVQTGTIRGGAKIHAADQTLVAEPPQRYRRRRQRETRARMVRLGRTFADEAESLLLRLSCAEAGLVVQEGRSGSGRGVGGLWAAAGGGGGGGGRRGRSGRAGRQPLGGAGADADAAMMMAYGIDDDDSSSDDEGGHGGGGGGGGGDEEMRMMMDVDDDDDANPC